MKQILVIILAGSLAFPLAAVAQQRPIAALGRVAVLGEISEVDRQIIQNRLESFLSQHYDLVSEEEYAGFEREGHIGMDYADHIP